MRTLPRRSARRTGRTIVGCVFLIGFLQVVATSRPALATTLNGGIVGGGLQNVVAVDPHGTGVVISGADVAGFQVGANNGTSFVPRNGGAGFEGDLLVATIKFASKSTNVYAGTGAGGTVPGFWLSTDNGQTWTKPAKGTTFPTFSGINLDKLNYRSTGKLIALDESVSPPIIYAATYNKGVMRSIDNGVTWSVIGLSGKKLRGIAIDPMNRNQLWVASYNDGVYVTTNASGSCISPCNLFPTAPMTGSPTYPEDMVALGDAATATSLYVAAQPNTTKGAPGGVFKLSGTTWTQLGAATLDTSAIWFTIDGYITAADEVRHLVVGCRDLCEAATGAWGTLYQQLYRSDDDGSTWNSMILPPAVINADEMGGAGGGTWWGPLKGGIPLFMLGQEYTGITDVEVDPSNTQRIFTAASGAVWRTDDGGLSWYPCVNGMEAIQAKDVAVDARVPGRVYVAAEDWTLFVSQDHGTTATRIAPPNPGGWGTAVAVNPTNSRVFVSIGSSDPTTGADIYSADPATYSWVSEGLGAADGGKRADGLAVDVVSGRTVLVASVVGSGIWRKTNNVWTKVLAQTNFAGTTPSVSWVHGSKLVYVYDRNSGLWLSKDYGVTWSLIWSKKSAAGLSGWVAADPTVTSTVYASLDSGVYKITSADVTPQISLLTLSSPGPVAVDASRRVWAATMQAKGVAPKLYRSTDQGATWVSYDDDTYRNSAGWPSRIVVGSDGYQYLALLHAALFIGQPVT